MVMGWWIRVCLGMQDGRWSSISRWEEVRVKKES